MLLRCAALAFTLIHAGMAFAGTIAEPSCAGSIEVRHALVVRVEKNGVLVLEDGRAVHLEGILLPSGAPDGAPVSFADQAISELGNLAVGRAATLAAASPKEDRYGRVRAQVFFRDRDEEPWLQLGMLSRGLARVSIAPDRRECARDLYAAEDRARARRIGIWAVDAYHVRMPSRVGATGTFQIVEGRVVSVSKSGGRVYLGFGTDRRRDFAASISSDDLRNFRETGVDPFSYADHVVRVRGWIERPGRPEIEVTIPEDIEIIEAPTLRGAVAPS